MASPVMQAAPVGRVDAPTPMRLTDRIRPVFPPAPAPTAGRSPSIPESACADMVSALQQAQTDDERALCRARIALAILGAVVEEADALDACDRGSRLLRGPQFERLQAARAARSELVDYFLGRSRRRSRRSAGRRR